VLGLDPNDAARPLVLAVHEAPFGEHPYDPIHLEMRRPLRPLGIRRGGAALKARPSRGGCGGTVVALSERGALDDVDTLIR
jgi:hypothetical protein